MQPPREASTSGRPAYCPEVTRINISRSCPPRNSPRKPLQTTLHNVVHPKRMTGCNPEGPVVVIGIAPRPPRPRGETGCRLRELINEALRVGVGDREVVLRRVGLVAEGVITIGWWLGERAGMEVGRPSGSHSAAALVCLGAAPACHGLLKPRARSSAAACSVCIL